MIRPKIFSKNKYFEAEFKTFYKKNSMRLKFHESEEEKNTPGRIENETSHSDLVKEVSWWSGRLAGIKMINIFEENNCSSRE